LKSENDKNMKKRGGGIDKNEEFKGFEVKNDFEEPRETEENEKDKMESYRSYESDDSED